jgi:hypothetical protein
MKILETIKQILGLTPKPKSPKEKKLEMLLYLRETLKTRNCFMCLAIYNKFNYEEILKGGLETMIPELHQERPKNRLEFSAWGTQETSDEGEAKVMWDYRKQAVENAIITVQNYKD